MLLGVCPHFEVHTGTCSCVHMPRAQWLAHRVCTCPLLVDSANCLLKCLYQFTRSTAQQPVLTRGSEGTSCRAACCGITTRGHSGRVGAPEGAGHRHMDKTDPPWGKLSLPGSLAWVLHVCPGPSTGGDHTHLDVAVHHIPRVQVLQGRDDLCTIKAGPLLREDALPGQVEEQLPGEGKGGRTSGPWPRGGEDGTLPGGPVKTSHLLHEPASDNQKGPTERRVHVKDDTAGRAGDSPGPSCMKGIVNEGVTARKQRTRVMSKWPQL